MNLSRLFVEKRQVAWVALIATLLWGIVAYGRLPQRKDRDRDQDRGHHDRVARRERPGCRAARDPRGRADGATGPEGRQGRLHDTHRNLHGVRHARGHRQTFGRRRGVGRPPRARRPPRGEAPGRDGRAAREHELRRHRHDGLQRGQPARRRHRARHSRRCDWAGDRRTPGPPTQWQGSRGDGVPSCRRPAARVGGLGGRSLLGTRRRAARARRCGNRRGSTSSPSMRQRRTTRRSASSSRTPGERPGGRGPHPDAWGAIHVRGLDELRPKLALAAHGCRAIDSSTTSRRRCATSSLASPRSLAWSATASSRR